MLGRLHSILVSAILAFYSLSGAFKIDGDPPTVEFKPTNSNPLFAAYKAEMQTKMNAEVAAAFNNALDTARKNLKGFGNQKELAQAFANANAYSANSATLQGYQNYSLFALSCGLMLGLQAPSPSLDVDKIGSDIKDKGDIYAGVGAGFSFVNLGINAKFIHDGMYLNVKYGALAKGFGDFKMDYSVMGFGVNYRLFETKSLVGLVKWRGVSVGSGFYIQSNKLNMTIKPDDVTTPAHFHDAVMAGSTTGPDSLNKEILLDEMGYGKNDSDAIVTLSPTFNMGLDVTTMTVPLDAVTAVSVLFGMFNVTAGVGFDLNFGSSEVVLKGKSSAAISSDTTKVVFKDAEVRVDGSSESGPSIARMRAMTGIGLGLGPVKIDVPLIYYVKSGMAVGLTVAVVW